MPLLADYQSRYSTQIRTNVSNPQNTSPTTPDTTLEGLAATDVAARFQAECGVAYSSSTAIHVDVCCPAVFAKLQIWTGQADQSFYDKAIEAMRAVKLVLGRDRITPTTDSLLDPTKDTSGDLPFADRTQFNQLIPNAPGGTTTSDSRNTTTD